MKFSLSSDDGAFTTIELRREAAMKLERSILSMVDLIRLDRPAAR